MSDEVSGSTAGKPQKKVAKKLIIVDGNEPPAKVSSKSIVIKDDSTDINIKESPVEESADVLVDQETKESEAEEKPFDIEDYKIEDDKKTIKINLLDDEETTNEEPLEQPQEQEPEKTKDTPKVITVGDAIDANEEPLPEAEISTEPTVEDSEQQQDEPEEESSEVEPEPSNDAEPTKDKEEFEDNEFADNKTATAVDDIVANESDELLKRQDEEKLDQQKAEVKKDKLSLKSFFSKWWNTPLYKWGTFVVLIAILIAVGLLPTTRYAVLNSLGIRAKSSMTIVNEESQQPLKNVEVTMSGQSLLTDENGIVNFSKLKLGKNSYKVSKRGYSLLERTKVLGWGSNPIGQISIKATGNKFNFVVNDFLSNKAVLGAEAVSGDFNAVSDKNGNISLAVDQNVDKDVEVIIKAAGYREEKLTVKISDLTKKTVSLVPSKKHVFVSKRSGKYDVYKIDADGKNESLLLAATGAEREDMIILPHPTTNFVAIVSSRDGVRNKDGYLMSGLFIVNVATGESVKVTQSERIQLVDWVSDRVVFIAVKEGASAANASRSKLLSFEIGQPGAKELSSANYFNDAVVFRGSVYYAPSSYAIPVANVKFYKVNADGSNLTVVLDKEVWNVFRSDYDTLYLSVQQDWYELKTTGSATKLANSPTNPRSRMYKDSPDKNKGLWVDSRDGKGVLLAYNQTTKKDDIIETKSGLNAPAYWLNDTTVVYRVMDGREVADYVKSTDGGEAKKLRDVTNTDTSNYFN
ncbi:MAG: hypothetical protein WCJ60_02520 [bacterium]